NGAARQHLRQLNTLANGEIIRIDHVHHGRLICLNRHICIDYVPAPIPRVSAKPEIARWVGEIRQKGRSSVHERPSRKKITAVLIHAYHTRAESRRRKDTDKGDAMVADMVAENGQFLGIGLLDLSYNNDRRAVA